MPQEKKLGRKVENSEIFRCFKIKENFDHNSSENDDFDDGRIWKPKKPVRNLLDNHNSLPQEKNWVEKLKTQKFLGVLRNIENFDHNSAENDDFDKGRIWKPKKPVRNLLDNDNSLPQEKKIEAKSPKLRNLWVF